MAGATHAEVGERTAEGLSSSPCKQFIQEREVMMSNHICRSSLEKSAVGCSAYGLMLAVWPAFALVFR